ncbi:MAG: hypothetical protein ACJAZO_001649 [Myxococcota bacterium]|jgi:hypothetical protein
MLRGSSMSLGAATGKVRLDPSKLRDSATLEKSSTQLRAHLASKRVGGEGGVLIGQRRRYPQAGLVTEPELRSAQADRRD